MLLKLPQNICFILDSLESHGFEAFAVGGCVRDMLMGIKPHDFDITTNALPHDVKAIFPHTADTGIEHGTVTVIHGDTTVEVTTYRTEGIYTDSRRPDSVEFVSDINRDLARRDFTVNAICFSPKRGLVDPYGGQTDIKNKTLRAVGDPNTRFCEDALRILRLFRFAAKLRFTAEDNTIFAALELCDKLSRISTERIASELLKTAVGCNPAAITPLIKRGGLNFIGINGCDDLSSTGQLPAREELRIFALLFLCGCNPAETARKLKYKNSIVKYCSDMYSVISSPLPQNRVEIKKILKNYTENIIFDVADFYGAVYKKDLSALKNETSRIIESGDAYRTENLDINGKDLIEIGFSGSDIGKTLNLLLDRVITEPELNNKSELLSLAKEIYRH